MNNPFSRGKTLRCLIAELQKMVEADPSAGDLMVMASHSASGENCHINSAFVKVLDDWDLDDEFGCFFEEEGLVVGDRVVEFSMGGN